jgi:hypothetical protein
MLRAPSSWLSTLTKLGFSRSKKSRTRSAPRRLGSFRSLNGVEQLEDRAMLSAVGLLERIDGLGVSADGFIEVQAGGEGYDSWSEPYALDDEFVSFGPENPLSVADDGAAASGDLLIKAKNPTPVDANTYFAEVMVETIFAGSANASSTGPAFSRVQGYGNAGGVYEIQTVPDDAVYVVHIVAQSKPLSSHEDGDGEIDVAPWQHFDFASNEGNGGWVRVRSLRGINDDYGDSHADWDVVYNLPVGATVSGATPATFDGVVSLDITIEWPYDETDDTFTLYTLLDYDNNSFGASYADAPIETSGNNSASFEWFTSNYLSMQLVDADSSDLNPGGGEPLFPELAPPKVKNIILSDSTVNSNPDYEFGDGNVGSGVQLKTVPVGNVNRISVQFTKEVALADSDLELIALNRVVTEPTPDLIQSPNSGNNYTAIWSLSGALPAAQYLMRLAQTIEDLDGNALDGEWTNPGSVATTDPTTVFPSGNNVAGGDFEFVFTILPGDVNRDNYVNVADLGEISTYYSNSISGRTWAQGDFNGDGYTNIADLGDYSTYSGKNWSTLQIRGDYDLDYDVDSADHGQFMTYYSASPKDIAADIDGSGTVNVVDVSAFTDLYGFGIALSVLV